MLRAPVSKTCVARSAPTSSTMRRRYGSAAAKCSVDMWVIE